jgi:hypothetical protein
MTDYERSIARDGKKVNKVSVPLYNERSIARDGKKVNKVSVPLYNTLYTFSSARMKNVAAGLVRIKESRLSQFPWKSPPAAENPVKARKGGCESP